MFRFVLGVIVGALAASWLQRAQNQELVERRLGEMQERANAVLVESRRILEETRRELSAALEAGRKSVESRAERLRRSAEEGRTEGGQEGGEQSSQG